MPKIEIVTAIRAPIELCFDLARDVGVHTETVAHTHERVIGKTRLLDCSDTVTWEAIHFGIRQRLTAKITEMNRPYHFTDVQVKGAFHSFSHRHLFTENKDGTIMKDIFEYRAPLGVLGKIADRVFLKRYMENFLSLRAEELKQIAERRAGHDAQIWKQV